MYKVDISPAANSVLEEYTHDNIPGIPISNNIIVIESFSKSSTNASIIKYIIPKGMEINIKNLIFYIPESILLLSIRHSYNACPHNLHS